MVVTKILEVTQVELNDFIRQQILSDIEQSNGNKIALSDLKSGYQYQKELKNKMGKSGQVITRIEELSDTCYKASFESWQGINTLCYQMKPIDKTHTEVTYEEEYNTESKANSLNYKLMSMLYSKSNKQRIHVLLSNIENMIKEKRESAVR